MNAVPSPEVPCRTVGAARSREILAGAPGPACGRREAAAGPAAGGAGPTALPSGRSGARAGCPGSKALPGGLFPPRFRSCAECCGGGATTPARCGGVRRRGWQCPPAVEGGSDRWRGAGLPSGSSGHEVAGLGRCCRPPAPSPASGCGAWASGFGGEGTPGP